MNSIVTVGTSVNESTQSIHALIEEMTEATGCVSQAMGDITVSMESTVASIQGTGFHDRTDNFRTFCVCPLWTPLNKT